jgi:uncharacterized Zn finger protein
MKDFRNATHIILNCPTCGTEGAHKHQMLDHPAQGKDCHLVECLACGQQSLFTKKTFHEISDRIETI